MAQNVIRDGKMYTEYSPQELEALRLNQFIERSHRWGDHLRAIEQEKQNARPSLVQTRLPKRQHYATPNKYKLTN